MNKRKPLIFVDSNVLIAAFYHHLHPAAAIAIFAANKKIKLITCKQVIVDVEEEILSASTDNNYHEAINDWSQFLNAIKIQVVPDPEIKTVQETKEKYLGLMKHTADIPILAAAIKIQPDLIVSDNREHFNDKVAQRCKIKILSCKDFLMLSSLAQIETLLW